MIENLNIKTNWIQELEKGQQPSGEHLKKHLTMIHDNNAGFTETIAWNCRDLNGKNSYELLADIIDVNYHSNVLDLGCGSGVLLDLCNKKFGDKLGLIGVDMNKAELKLAHERLINTNTELHHGVAQNLNFIEDSSVDVILCHWALSLMDPIVPVLNTIKRILRNKGVFGAIIEGDFHTAPNYSEINKIIYEHVRKEYPNYGAIELGDMRFKSIESLKEITSKTFDNIDIHITPYLLSYRARPDIMAREVAGFFYASFVLTESGHRRMLDDLEVYFCEKIEKNLSNFAMPVRLVVIS